MTIYLNVMNHGKAQKRPVQFTVPLSLSWGDVIAVTDPLNEVLLAEKQYDDGDHAVYVCPPPEGGWAGMSTAAGADPMGYPTQCTIAASSLTPNYTFRPADAFVEDYVCGDPLTWDHGILPELRIYATDGDPNPIKMKPTNFYEWSEGRYPGTNEPIPNGGTMRQWFAASADSQGWHLRYYMCLDSNCAVLDFYAVVEWSDETSWGIATSANDPSHKFWKTPCFKIELAWATRHAVKAMIPMDGLQVSGSTMALTMDFDHVGDVYGWNYGAWGGYWHGQCGMAMCGHLIGRQTAQSPVAGDETLFTNSQPLYAHLDAATWDTLWLGGGDSGATISSAMLNPQNSNPDYADTYDDHFWTWHRGGSSRDSLGTSGQTVSMRPQSAGTQGNFGMARGQEVLLNQNSMRNYFVGAIDYVKRQHWVKCQPDGSHVVDGVWMTEPGRYAIEDSPQLTLTNGKFPDNPNLWRFGRPSGQRGDNYRAVIPRSERVAIGSRSGVFKDWFGEHCHDNQHANNQTGPAAYLLTKNPVLLECLSWYLQWHELSERRPNTPGSAISGSREIGRKFSALSSMWRAAPGLRDRIHNVVYDKSLGYYYALNRTYENAGLWFLHKTRLPGTPAGLPTDKATIPDWMKKPQQWSVRNFQPQNFLYYNSSTVGSVFGAAEPLWEAVGGAGLLMWYDTMVNHGGDYFSSSAEEVTDFGDWGQRVVENVIQLGLLDWVANNWKIPNELCLTYKAGHHVLSNGMRNHYPPEAGQHPFYVTSHSLFSSCGKWSGSNEQSWTAGAFNWYRHYGRKAHLKAEAERTFLDMMERDSGNRDKYKGWQQVFWASTAPLSLTPVT